MLYPAYKYIRIFFNKYVTSEYIWIFVQYIMWHPNIFCPQVEEKYCVLVKFVLLFKIKRKMSIYVRKMSFTCLGLWHLCFTSDWHFCLFCITSGLVLLLAKCFLCLVDIGVLGGSSVSWAGRLVGSVLSEGQPRVETPRHKEHK